jgi:hypothetical protein
MLPYTGTTVRWFRIALVLSSAIAGYRSVLAACADHFSRSPELTDRERAARWLPTPTILDRLATKREEEGQESLALLERATALDPRNPERHMRLALHAELAGDATLSERSLLKAAALSRLYQPRFLLAQYYGWCGASDGLEAWSRAALRPAYGDVLPLLQLCWRMQTDGGLVSEVVANEKPEIARQGLALLVSRELTDAAYVVASHVVDRAAVQDMTSLLGFCNLSLSRGRNREAMQVWNRLCQRGLLPYRALTQDSPVTNTDFSRTPLNAGFDWHVERAPWIQSTAFRDGLRVHLTGLQPEQCLIAWEYVPTAAGQNYRLRWESQGDEKGFIWVPFDLAGKPIPATRTDFTAPGQVLRLALMYQRPSGFARLNGAAEVKWLSMEAVP